MAAVGDHALTRAVARAQQHRRHLRGGARPHECAGGERRGVPEVRGARAATSSPTSTWASPTAARSAPSSDADGALGGKGATSTASWGPHGCNLIKDIKVVALACHRKSLIVEAYLLEGVP